MKYSIPLAASLLLGLAAWMHPVMAGPSTADRRLPPKEGTLSPTAEVEMRRESCVQAVAVPAAVPKGEPSGPTGRPRKAESDAWRRTSGILVLELSLTVLQKEAVEQILRNRSEEIRICHEEIRRSGLLDIPAYEWQVARMKESWYRKIDGVLDSVQHQRFVGLVEQGLFNEGLGFTQVPGMTVLD